MAEREEEVQDTYDFQEEFYNWKGHVVTLSPSLWSLALVLPMLNAPADDMALIVFPYIVQLLALILTQVMFIWHIETVASEAEFKCELPATALSYLCVGCLLLSMCAGEFQDCFDMLGWIRQIPVTRDNSETLRFKLVKRTCRGEDVDCWRPAFGMSHKYRMVTIGLLVIGRFALATALLIVGSAHILNSDSTEDQILNAVAVVFVLDLDDLLYRFCVPGIIRDKFEDMPGLTQTFNTTTTRREIFSAFWPSVSCPFLAFATIALVQFWCTDDRLPIIFGFGIPMLMGCCCCIFCGMVSMEGGETKFDPFAEMRNRSGSVLSPDRSGSMLPNLDENPHESLKTGPMGDSFSPYPNDPAPDLVPPLRSTE